MVKALKNSSKYIIYICGIILFLTAVLTAVEVVSRKFFAYSFGGVDEISTYVLAIIISWSMAYVLFEKMHIRIDILYHMFSKKLQYYLDFLAMSINLVFLSMLTYYSFDVFYSSIKKDSHANTPLGTPLWIPQLLWFLGFLFFLIVIISLFLKSFQNLAFKEKNECATINKEN